MILNHTEIEAWGGTALKHLYWDGSIKLPWVWPENEVNEYIRHMKSAQVYPGHVWNKGDGKPRSWNEARSLEVLSYRTEDTIRAPYFFEFALQFTDIARQYLGSTPHMYSCNAFWTRPGSQPPHVDIQQWHRDRDDTKFLVLFMYGTDVLTDEDGPHLVGKGSHRHNDGQHRPPYEPVEKIYGKAGTFFLVDASALHMGIKPKSHERLLAWARWCVSENPQSYGWDGTKPTPATTIPLTHTPDSSLKQSTTLLVDWDK